MTDNEERLSFANFPKTLSEVRAQKERDGAKWTPRDALIDLLRRADSGEIELRAMVIAATGTVKGEEKPSFTWSNATPDVYTALGLAARFQIEIMTKG